MYVKVCSRQLTERAIIRRMGLDSVHLLMGVEKEFGITISQSEASEIVTLGDLHRCVMSKLATCDKSSCLSQRAFHLLRSNAVKQFGIPRQSFRPDTELESFIPRTGRRQQWLQLQKSVGAAHWPELGLSMASGITLLLVLFLVPAVAYWYSTSIVKWNPLVAILIGFAAMVITAHASRYFMRPFMTEFKGFVRVKELAYALVARDPQLLGSEPVMWVSEEVWSLLAAVVRAETGVSEFNKDSRIVADLGID